MCLFLHLNLVFKINYRTQILNLNNIRLLQCIFVFNILIEYPHNVNILERSELLIIDDLESFYSFMRLYIVNNFFREVEIIDYNFLPQYNFLLTNWYIRFDILNTGNKLWTAIRVRLLYQVRNERPDADQLVWISR